MIICILGVFLGCTSSLFGQSAPSMAKTFYYKDGSVFRGRVLYDNYKSVLLKLATGDTIELAKDQIVLRQVKIKKDKFHFNKGVFVSANLGISVEPQVNLLIGYRLNEKYDLALGAGIHPLSRYTGGIYSLNTFYSLYAHGRKYFGREKSNRWYLFMNAGYSIGDNNDNGFFNDNIVKGGALFEPGLGIQFGSRKKIRYSLSLSQQFQYSSGEINATDFLFNTNVNVKHSSWNSRTVLKFGINFK